MRTPDFLIVGAPKCGTTALCHYLSEHPEVAISTPAKPYFFGRDLNVPRTCERLEDYLALFDENALCCGEGTPYYLYSQTAAQEIYDLNPAMKIIIMLRNPVDVAYSLYCQRLSNSIDSEPILDFAEAIAAEGDRAQGKRLPPAYPDPKMVLYTEIAKFYPQVQRYVDRFPPEQLHVVIYDDLRADVDRVYGQVLTFLGVDSAYRPPLQVVNPNTTWRSRGLQALVESPPKPLKTSLKRLGISGKTLYPLYRALTRFNQKVAVRSPLDPAMKLKLQNLFYSDVEQLSQLLGRSLLHWLED
ncbi:sulfotransferase [Leptolyngbya sp. CCY15150]|uniref:sulfotransferase family protein n=1 Tax=Leptolyngbya sp. CCY15150 TaxID=2767772 RepID=UPI0019519F55|nr:sulfotransferase [Leptolyngbya sp. CCY15150]